MKRLVFSLLASAALATSCFAQAWNMVVTREDGTKEVIPTSAVKNVSFEKVAATGPQVIIKEIYCAGNTSNDGKDYFMLDQGFVLYNNSATAASLNNLAVAFVGPFNAQSNNPWRVDGKLSFEKDGFVPATFGVWYFQGTLNIQPYSQVVVCVNGAVDNTADHPQSVNYANADYYAMYDPASGYNNVRNYPTPSPLIPTSHYLKAVRFWETNTWTLSSTSPGLFLFQTKDVTPPAFAGNANNVVYAPGTKQKGVNACLKVPQNWVLDGVEVFGESYVASSKKRFPSSIDAGSVLLTKEKGHTLYRNVDKEETEKLPENKGKLVYGYTMGVSTGDPSGIDAEASIKNGAHIIYMDTNNSTNDFHERKAFSIKGK